MAGSFFVRGINHSQHAARFGTGSDSLLAQLECPAKRGPSERTVLFCQAHVLADGTVADRKSLRNSFCFGTRIPSKAGGKLSTSTRRYESAMQRALKKARFLPAEIDGVPVPVYFSFQVVFEDKDGCVATAFPNLGYRTSELGAGYVAPQELMTDGGWTKRMRFFESIIFPSPGVFFSMSVMVDENGTATDGRVEYTNPVSPSRITPSAPDMAASAAKALEASKFIPGFHQGVPVPMRYLEILFVGSVLRL